MTDPTHSILLDIKESIGELLAETRSLRRDVDGTNKHHAVHEDENRRDFAQVRESMSRQFAEQAKARDVHLSQQDKILDAMRDEQNRAKGAGWVIIGILGALATFIGGAVISVLSGFIRVKLG